MARMMAASKTAPSNFNIAFPSFPYGFAGKPGGRSPVERVLNGLDNHLVKDFAKRLKHGVSLLSFGFLGRAWGVRTPGTVF